MTWVANDGTVLISSKPLIICSDGKIYTYLGDNKTGGPLLDGSGEILEDYVESFFKAMWRVVEIYGGRNA